MPNHSLQPFPQKGAFRRALLGWYDAHQRDLPWRRSPDPYRVLISEFMLQQTRVETVIPYYQRFLTLFPTLEHLAKAPLQKVLKSWAGLGYYARARNLHEACRTIWRDFGGEIPPTRERLRQLPGFGPYTAGAVASLAFGEPVAAVDGNVRRIFGRLLDPPPAAKGLEDLVTDWVPPGRASAFNQALMDLGATVCLPARPRCAECPVRRFCSSQGEGSSPKEKAKKPRKEIWAVALVEDEGRFLLHRREGTGLLAGLWQFPTRVTEKDEDPSAALVELLHSRFGLKARSGRSLPLQTHLFTHIHAAMKPFLFTLASPAPDRKGSKEIRWLKPSAFHRVPISTAMGKIAALAGCTGQGAQTRDKTVPVSVRRPC